VVPALILGGVSTTTLGVMRGLGRQGIPAYTVGAGSSFVSRSRWHRRLPGPSDRTLTAESLHDFLAALPFDRMVLFPCSDPWLAAVGALEPQLAARFPASLASAETLDILLDKARFATVLAHLGLPHPRTVPIEPSDPPSTFPDWALTGAFLKPRNSDAFRQRFGVKARRFADLREAMTLVAEAGRYGIGLVLQEYVPGPPTRHCMVEGFVDRSGSVRGRLARQRLRMYPTDFGDSVWMVTVPLATVAPALETLDRLFTRLGYRGIFEAEFKLDERDGQWKLLEVNARPWGFIAFAARCGLEVCTMAYRDALGLPVDPVVEYTVGRHCVQPSIQWGLVREGRLGVWSWGWSLVGATQLVLCLDDPGPAVADFLQWARRKRIRTGFAAGRGAA
jgi:D-aspartate ligase